MRISISLLIFLFAFTCNSVKLIEVLGVTSRIYHLVKMSPNMSNPKPGIEKYMKTPNITNYLAMFKTKTEFCDYTCEYWFHLPCFILFSCVINIRDMVLLIFGPILAISVTGVCCGRGIWTLSCWMRYLSYLTGIRIIIWILGSLMESEGQKEEDEGNDDSSSDEDEDNKKSSDRNVLATHN